VSSTAPHQALYRRWRAQTFSEIVISFHASPTVFAKTLIFSDVMNLIGGLVPAIRASQMSPIEAIHD